MFFSVLLASTHRAKNQFAQNQHGLLILNVAGLKALERIDGDEGCQCVELLLGILILVSPALEAHADARGNAVHTVRPDGLVEVDVNAHVLGAHRSLSELLDLLHSTRRTVLERAAQR
jgi:hypothetical protein